MASSWQTSFAEQWKNPEDIFSLLLIVGGDIVSTALAQLAGHSDLIPAPVPFSFGWVAFAYNSIKFALGEHRLMPPTTDVDSLLINASNGITRKNNSWVLGRLLRDMEPENLPEIALRIEVHEMVRSQAWWFEHCDLLWWSGLLAIVAQLTIAAIPAGLDGDWSFLIITGGGTILALAHSIFPQWRREKWACRRLKSLSEKTVCITRGNGSQFVLVVKANAGDYNLEDLASARSLPSVESKILSIIFAVLWTALLVTAISAKSKTWYLVGVGLLGMLQNIHAAGSRRTPEAHGIPLRSVRTIEDIKVMRALEKAEIEYPGLGRSLLNTFFPQGLRPDEWEWWNPNSQPTTSQNQHAAPQGQPTAPQVQPTAPQGQPTAPQGQPTAPQVQPTAPQGQPTAPQVQPTAPQGQPTAPQGQPTAPQVQPTAPQGQPTAPQGQPTAPQGQPTAPQGQPTAPQG